MRSEPTQPAAYASPEACDATARPDTAARTNTATRAGTAPTPPRCIPSRELLGKETTLAIVHEGVVYHLRTTRLGKLILTK